MGQGMSAQPIYEALNRHGRELGAALAPHDVRRTLAKLAHQGRAPLEQIQLSLSYAPIQTTELSLGVDQNLKLPVMEFKEGVQGALRAIRRAE